MSLTLLAPAAPASQAGQRELFKQAWDAAARGDRQTFEQLGQGLESYLLYPYHRYEHYRANRTQVRPDEMASFLDQHDGWAFTEGLRQAWLRTLGKRRDWQALLAFAEGELDTETTCYLARARIQHGPAQGLLAEVQSLWTAGKSQPDACDPAFDWLRKQGGITPALAWKRIELAMQAGNPRFTLYLQRYVPPPERDWVRRWQELNRVQYRGLARTRSWPDKPIPRMIVATSLQRLARIDSEQALQAFERLDGHFSWPEAERGKILRGIVFEAALELEADAPGLLGRVPPGHRDGQLLEWVARAALAQPDWAALEHVISSMAQETRQDGRWRYWRGMALRALGDRRAAQAILEPLSTETSYYGFLAADELGLPYTICPREPAVNPDQVASLRQRPDFGRSLELRAAGLDGWAASEWGLAASRLDSQGLRAAAALAREEAWHDRVIFALGDSGDRRYYEWRFPVLWEQAVDREAARRQLDKSWVLGVMRSESALATGARSSAGALGLMQMMPATAQRLSRQHGLPYSGPGQLREAEPNIRFGTTFMRELLDRYDQNPVLVAGAYNAGPNAVDRWLRTRPVRDTAVWVETIPYFETRDYIPRVLAFTAIYDWRLDQPVKRISTRMPGIDSGNMTSPQTAQVVCLGSG